MKTLNTSTFAKLAVLGLALAVSGQALAGAHNYKERSYSTKVDARDIDFGNPSDVEELYKRIGKAARRVCRTAFGPISSTKTLQGWRVCIDTAVENAVLSANSPTLTAVHRGATERLAGL